MLGPGDFTRVFGQKDLSAAPPAPAGATGAFASPAPFEEIQAEPATSGPSEYTKLFKTPAGVPSAPAPAAPSPEPAPAAVATPSKISPVFLYVLLGLLACAAIGTVLFFALRH